jgi:hypothetical protein
MYKLIETILIQFRSCFKRNSTFECFVIIVIGMLLRRDFRGISSIVSTLRLEPKCYDNLIHLFRSKAKINQMAPKDGNSLPEPENDSIVAKMIRLAAKSIMRFQQNTFLILDVAFEPAIFSTNQRGRGRPAKYGKKVNLKELFQSRPQDFQTAKISLYGKLETIEYLCLDLLWKPVKGRIRFVLVKHGSTPFILMYSDLTVPALQIIELYGYRFKVEVMFKSLKNTIGSFFYHFWTAALPKFSRKTTETDLSRITDPKDKKKIVATAKAIEVFTFIGCVTMGILQLIALHYPAAVWNRFTGWLRTKTPGVTSVETVRASLQEEVLWNFRKLSKFNTLQLIFSRQRQSLFLYDEDAS